VAVGMAVGAGHLGVAVAGIVVMSIAAFAMRGDVAAEAGGAPGALPFSLVVRVGLGVDAAVVVAPVVDQFASRRRLLGVATARQGGALDVSYGVDLKDDTQATALIAALNRLDGVQSVGVSRTGVEAES
jgi:hypothetical protein